MTQSRQSNSGLSQLEMLIALAIMGLLAVLMANALQFNKQALDGSGHYQERVEWLQNRFELQRRVEGMSLSSSGNAENEMFVGETDEFRFKAFAPESSTKLVEFRVGMATNQKALVTLVTETSGNHQVNDSAPNQLILASGLDMLQIQYFGHVVGDITPRWHSVWEEVTHLPELIKMEWKPIAGSPAPPLTIVPAKVARQRYMSLSSLSPPG